MTERIKALARAQDLITFEPDRGIALDRLVTQTISPIVPEPSRLSIEGRSVRLTGANVSGFALVLHELGTNALKYGAWSNGSGRVDLRWHPTPAGLSMTWCEQGGPVISAPQSQGLGSLLIAAALPRAKVERRFRPSGVEVVFKVPLDPADQVGPI